MNLMRGPGICGVLAAVCLMGCGSKATPLGSDGNVGGASATTQGSTNSPGGSKGDAESSDSASPEGGAGGAFTCDTLDAASVCASNVQNSEECGLPHDDVQTCIASNSVFYDRADPCTLTAILECDEACEATENCHFLAVVDTHPELFHVDQVHRCIDRNSSTALDCSPEARFKGRLLACFTAALECGDVFTCLSAVMLKDEFLPQVDACIAGPCEDFNACLLAVTDGE